MGTPFTHIQALFTHAVALRNPGIMLDSLNQLQVCLHKTVQLKAACVPRRVPHAPPNLQPLQPLIRVMHRWFRSLPCTGLQQRYVVVFYTHPTCQRWSNHMDAWPTVKLKQSTVCG